MKKSLLTCAIGAAAMAASGCAYHGSSHNSGSSWSSFSYPAAQTHQRAYRPGGYAQRQVGGTRFELEIGAEEFNGGEMIANGTAIGPTTYRQVDYKDAYKRGYRASAGLSRDIRPNTAFTAKGFYMEAEGEDPFVIADDVVPLSGRFTDYKSYGAEIGLRQYLGNSATGLRPFVGGTVGAAYIDDIDVVAIGIGGPLNEAGWVPTASATGGFELPVSPSASFALESGLRWTGSQDRTAIASAAGFADAGDTTSIPVTLRGRFRF